MSKGGMIFLAILFFLIAIVGNIAINGFIVWVIWDVILVRVIQSIQPISFWLCCLIGVGLALFFHPIKASAKFS